jgi:hypothetical protein
VIEAGALTNPDLATVEAVASLQLSARRLGCSMRLRHPPRELLELLALVGLGDVVLPNAGLKLGPKGQTEEREQSRGVEEEVEPDDPTG